MALLSSRSSGFCACDRNAGDRLEAASLPDRGAAAEFTAAPDENVGAERLFRVLDDGGTLGDDGAILDHIDFPVRRRDQNCCVGVGTGRDEGPGSLSRRDDIAGAAGGRDARAMDEMMVVVPADDHRRSCCRQLEQLVGE